MTYRHVAADRRRKIVRRIHGNGETCITVARIETPDELEFAIRFLTDHYAYKRARYELGGDIREAARRVRDALHAACDSFHSEVGERYGVSHPHWNQPTTSYQDHGGVSDLGDGEVLNPYDRLGHKE